jgi:hypothetical protein
VYLKNYFAVKTKKLAVIAVARNNIDKDFYPIFILSFKFSTPGDILGEPPSVLSAKCLLNTYLNMLPRQGIFFSKVLFCAVT